MMETIRQFGITASGSLPISVVLKVTLTAAAALLSARIAHRSRAALRHALLLAAFGVMLVLPVAAAIAPALTISVAVPAQVVEASSAGSATSHPGSAPAIDNSPAPSA